MYEFEKLDIPSDAEIKSVFIENLMKFRVSLQQYKNAIDMEEVIMLVKHSIYFDMN